MKNPFLELIRPNVCLLTILALTVGIIITGSYVITAIPAIIAGFLICGAGNSINDYFDVKIDKENRPERPIPSKRITKNQALVHSILLYALGIVLSALVSVDFLIIAVFNVIVTYVYSWKLKGLPIIGNISVAYLGAASFLSAGLIIGSFTSLIGSAILILSIISFVGTLSREILKDIEDITGDLKQGLKTLPIIIEKKKAKIIAYIILLIAVALLYLPINTLSSFYLLGAIPGAIMSILAIVKNNPAKSQRLVKVAMYLIMLGFLLGSIL